MPNSQPEGDKDDSVCPELSVGQLILIAIVGAVVFALFAH